MVQQHRSAAVPLGAALRGLALRPPPAHAGPLIRTPDEHAAALHPATAPGLVTLAFRDGPRWRQRFIAPADLPEAVRVYTGAADVYLTANRFRGPRSVLNLLQLGALWTDLDYYRTPYAGLEPWAVRDAALRQLEDCGLPAPGLAIATGRGLALLWRHTPIPRAALPRWQACQRRLYETLKPYGADRLAIDPARVLRLIGTRNSRTGALVEALSPLADAWNFEDLAREVLPLTRDQVGELRSLNAARAARPGGRPRPARHLTLATYGEALLSDLQALRAHRWLGSCPPGQRDAWLFVAAVALAWITPPAVLAREVAALGREAAGWCHTETASRTCSVLARARAAAAGKLVPYDAGAGAVQVDPRYRFKRATVIEWLSITEEEMRGAQLRILRSPGVARERQRARWHQRQAAAGRGTGADRRQYLATAARRRQEAAELRGQGKTWAEIAAALSVTPGAARKLASRRGGHT